MSLSSQRREPERIYWCDAALADMLKAPPVGGKVGKMIS